MHREIVVKYKALPWYIQRMVRVYKNQLNYPPFIVLDKIEFVRLMIGNNPINKSNPTQQMIRRIFSRATGATFVVQSFMTTMAVQVTKEDAQVLANKIDQDSAVSLIDIHKVNWDYPALVSQPAAYMQWFKELNVREYVQQKAHLVLIQDALLKLEDPKEKGFLRINTSVLPPEAVRTYKEVLDIIDQMYSTIIGSMEGVAFYDTIFGLPPKEGPMEEYYGRAAVKLGMMGRLKEYVATGKSTKGFISLAAMYGRTDMVKYLCTRDGAEPMDANEASNAISAAAKKSLELLKFFQELGIPVKNRWLMSAAAEGGNLPCVEYLHSIGCEWSEYGVWYAAKGGHLDILKFAHAHNLGWAAIGSVDACTGAIIDNHMDCLKYLIENYYDSSLRVAWKAAVHTKRDEMRRYIEDRLQLKGIPIPEENIVLGTEVYMCNRLEASARADETPESVVDVDVQSMGDDPDEVKSIVHETN